MELVTTSDDEANLIVAKLDEGHTVDDAIEQVEDPSTAAFPSWMSDMGALPGADPGETMVWERNLGDGEYVLLCTQSSVSGRPWVRGGLTVVAN